MIVGGDWQALGDDLFNRAHDILWHILRQERDSDPWGESNFTAIRIDLSAQHSQKRRLPRAVASEQADSLPRLNLARDTIEQQRSAKTDLQILDSD